MQNGLKPVTSLQIAAKRCIGPIDIPKLNTTQKSRLPKTISKDSQNYGKRTAAAVTHPNPQKELIVQRTAIDPEQTRLLINRVEALQKALKSHQHRREYRPNLFLNGKNLANKVTSWILKNISEKDIRCRYFMFGINDNLSNGKLFLYKGSDIGPYNTEVRTRALETWILLQANGSITPADLFQTAVRLTGGQIEVAFMLCWDFLVHGSYHAWQRNSFPTLLKLVDITGELTRFEGNGQTVLEVDEKNKPILNKDGTQKTRQIKIMRGDNFSNWYHFFGTALLSFVRENSAIYPLKTRVPVEFCLWLEKRMASDHIDLKKSTNINHAGVSFGKELAKNLRNFKDPQSFANSVEAKNIEFLYDSPEEYGPDWALVDGQSTYEYRSRTRLLPIESKADGKINMKLLLDLVDLGNLKDFDSLDILIDATSNWDIRVQRAALVGLSARSEAKAHKHLEDLSISDNKEISEIATLFCNAEKEKISIEKEIGELAKTRDTRTAKFLRHLEAAGFHLIIPFNLYAY